MTEPFTTAPAELRTPAAARAHLDAMVARSRRVVLGITGPPGAGKSTLARAIVAHYQSSESPTFAALAPMDGFHLSNHQLHVRGLTDRKGAIETFDVEGYVSLLDRIGRPADGTVFAPDYDRSLGEPVAARHAIEPSTRLVVTDGNYLADPSPGWRQVSRLLDELWMLTGDSGELAERLVRRHTSHGRSEREAVSWVASVDGPNATRVRACTHRCTHVVGQDALQAFDRPG